MSIGQMMRKLSPRTSRRGLLLVLVFLAALLVLRVGPPAMPALGDDFIEYWSAARLNTQGLNPYDPVLMLTLERELGWELPQPRMMWNPPHTMALFSPFLLLHYSAATWVWRGLALLSILLCAILIWRTSGGPAGDAWAALLAAGIFLPTIALILYGQTGVLLLLGIAGFAYFEKRGHDWLAGALLSLALVKPQVMALFLMTLGLWIVSYRRWRVLGGLALATSLLLAPMLALNPRLISQYLSSMGNDPVSEWLTPTIGTHLRLVFGWQRFWLQFAPLVPGIAWVLWRWNRYRSAWRWEAQIGPVLFASILFSPYAWLHDQVVLLVPLIGALALRFRLRSAHVVTLLLLLAFVPLYFGLARILASEPGRGSPFLHSAARDIWVAPLLCLWWWLTSHDSLRFRSPDGQEAGQVPRADVA